MSFSFPARRIWFPFWYDVYSYRPRIEGLFARIEHWVAKDTGMSHWRSITHDNVTTLYGFDEQSRIADPADPRKIYTYLICRTFDDRGNLTVYTYVAENGTGVNRAQAHEANRVDAGRAAQRYLKSITYSNGQPYFPDWLPTSPETPLPTDWLFEVIMDYGDHSPDLPTPVPDQLWSIRPDPFSSYRAGFEVRTYRRCRRVLLFHHFPDEKAVGKNCLVRSTDFIYSDEQAPTDPKNPIYTFLQSVTQSGYRHQNGTYLRKSMPPLEFEYSQPQVQGNVLTLDAASVVNLPEGLDGSRYQWVDLDGEGLSGILTDFGGAWGYRRNLSPLDLDGNQATLAHFGPLEPVTSLPSRNELGGQQRLVDLSGDGRLDAAAFDDPIPGFFVRTSDETWEPFRAFASLPRLNWSEPNLKFVDLTGDGLADVLLTEDGLFTFWPSLGQAGFGQAEQVPTPWDEERGPKVVLSDGTETVFLADMSGDGLSDIVRVRNGEVCYWPNLGYGRFGAKVSMDAAPRFVDEERFDPHRVRLADIDGSGTTDLVYVGDNGVFVCFNQCGNAWAEPHLLAVFPTADSLSTVQVIDLLGSGIACLVWSSPLPGEAATPLRYVDLMGAQKPHLLVRLRNNQGAETRLRYAPSTRFYLADKMAGRPWITRLPHLVHVVERSEVYDWIGRSRFVTRYAYHHGHFDGYEREFRGFGMVEQWDTEEHRADTAFPEADAANWDATSWSPPKRRRTWFHTGAFIEVAGVSQQYAYEYWYEPALSPDDRAAMLLPDTVLPTGLTPGEIREAYRALKGSMLRTEVYAEDSSPHAKHPYTVTEQNFSVNCLQLTGGNRHAVFLVSPRETLSFHYERHPDDPRVTHAVALEVDKFGHALRSLSIGYPRREGYAAPEPKLAANFRTMLAYDQTRLHIAATENRYTNDFSDATVTPDVHRIPVLYETINADLTGIVSTPPANHPGVTSLYRFDDLDAGWQKVWNGTHDIPYEEIPASDIDGTGTLPTTPTRRVVGHTRASYRSDDLTGMLPFGQIQMLALPGESYHLALTPSLLSRLFGARVSSATLTEGRYITMADANGWWIPSGRIFYSPGDADAPATELSEARVHFYLSRRSVDSFLAISRISYDAYDLLPQSTTDAVGNVTSAENDYRVLHPFHFIDANGNETQAAFDTLGMVVGTAVMGKAGEHLGDSLDGFDPDLTEAVTLAHLADPLNNPGTILGSASSRMLYDLFAYSRTRDAAQPDPPVVYTLTRETHVADLAAKQTTLFQHAFSYSDGFGREIQKKAQAEPGPVEDNGPIVTPRWISSGWTIYNNKGKPVRKYEPFFSATPQFEFARQAGVSSVLFYDPAGRTVATLHPDNTWEKAVFDPWRQESWDVNDTVLIADPRTDTDVGDYFRRLLGDAPNAFVSWHDQRIGGNWGDTPDERTAAQHAAQKTEAHAATPTVIHFDALGRPCLAVTDNGGGNRYPSRTALDAGDKPLAVFDALGRRVFEYCLREPQNGGGFRYLVGYDLAGNALYHIGMDGGERRSLANVAGQTIRAWDALGHIFRVLYDPLQRPTHRYVSTKGAAEILLERAVYGEGMPDRNLCGRLFRRYDTAGVASNERYDFKGNLLESTRQFALDYRQSTDWSALANLNDATALDAAAAPQLDTTDRFSATTVYDALNRPIQVVTPHTSGMRPNVVRPSYSETNQLQQVDAWLQQANAPIALLDPQSADIHAVTALHYNARGQRTSVAFGNGTITTYDYDRQTFRLAHLTTTRPGSIATNQRVVQDLTYTYDPAGNITRVYDAADIQNVIYFLNQRVDPSADYTYDPIYRLISATGREHLGQQAGKLLPPQQISDDDGFRTRQFQPWDGLAMGTYTETYLYDSVGNLEHMMHVVSSGSWTRHYTYSEPSQITPTETCNRLSRTSLPGDQEGSPYSAIYPTMSMVI